MPVACLIGTMTRPASVPPQGFVEAIREAGLDFHGLYAESAEGFRAPRPASSEAERAEFYRQVAALAAELCAQDPR